VVNSLFLEMRKYILIVVVAFWVPLTLFGQSRAMRNLSESVDDISFSLVFYYSTLKMLIPEDNQELKSIIYDIEKIKFMKIDESFASLGADINDQLAKDLKKEDYEEALSMRMSDGMVKIFIRGSASNTKGIFMILDQDSGAIVLDIKGKVPVDKLLTLNSEIESLSENIPFIGNSRNN